MNTYEVWEQLLHEVPVVEGVGLMEMIDYPAPMSKLLNQIIKKRRVTAVGLSELMDLPLDRIASLLPSLISKGYLLSYSNSLNETEYKVNLLRVRGREQFKDIWAE